MLVALADDTAPAPQHQRSLARLSREQRRVVMVSAGLPPRRPRTPDRAFVDKHLATHDFSRLPRGATC